MLSPLITRYGLTCHDDNDALTTTLRADKTVSMGKTRDAVHCPVPSCPILCRPEAEADSLVED
jgi:hypothetical protein